MTPAQCQILTDELEQTFHMTQVLLGAVTRDLYIIRHDGTQLVVSPSGDVRPKINRPEA